MKFAFSAIDVSGATTCRTIACIGGLVCLSLAGCGGPPGATPTGPTISPWRVTTEAPTNLPPRTPLEETIKSLYEREFGELVFRPAIFNDPRAVDCYGDGHLTSTFYSQIGGRYRSRVQFLYTSRDGSAVVRRDSFAPVVTPAGRFRVLVLLLTWPETFTSELLPLWEAAQAEINQDHASFAASHGFDGPIVSFESTNVLIPGIDVRTPNTVTLMRSMLVARGIATTDFDFVVTINVDPSKGEGGVAFPLTSSPAFIYVGNYFHATTRLSPQRLLGYARTVYHHEVAHHWGWPSTHDWAPTCGGTTLGHEPFIVPPILFGWEDTDGDGVPEILDYTSYGRN
jgi:hypothetical protein